MKIIFFTEEINYKFPSKEIFSKQICNIVEEEKYKLNNISIVFTNDDYLLKINKQYLKHDYYTDIITFDYSENKIISGDIFISIDRVTENSVTFKTPFLNELHRVIIHGILHLIGYNDHTPLEKQTMRNKENYYLRKIEQQ